MTGREWILAASRGTPLETKPVLMGAYRPEANAEGYVVEQDEVRRCLSESPDSACLVRVKGPLGRTMEEGERLIAMLESDPAGGDARLKEIQQTIREDIDAALGEGADGVFYVVDGATAEHSTPMEYGGHFLEVDREILSEYGGARINAIYVEGEEPYLEFVSDLPGHLFGWDVALSGRDVQSVREIRTGALFAASPSADVYYSADLAVGAAGGGQ